jgi:macrolide transport system ATP-binding/permease protein
VCTDIVDLDPSLGGVTRYGGAYTEYLDAKRRERLRWEQRYATEQDELVHLRESVAVTAPAINHHRAMKDRNKMSYGLMGERVQQQISRRVRNARHRLDELTRTQVRKPPEPLRFAATLTGRPTPDQLALTLREVRLAGRLDIGWLDVPASGRLMVTGPNGAGKSTLLNVLAGRLSPDTGEVRRAKGIRVGLLDQDVVFPDGRRTPRQLYDAVAGPTGAASVPLVQLGLLPPRDLDRPVGLLSVGQRRRVALALLIAATPDVLLLDEPTNHFSLRLVEELEDALREAPGAVVIASHDRWLRRTWDGPELSLVDGRVA